MRETILTRDYDDERPFRWWVVGVVVVVVVVVMMCVCVCVRVVFFFSSFFLLVQT